MLAYAEKTDQLYIAESLCEGRDRTLYYEYLLVNQLEVPLEKIDYYLEEIPYLRLLQSLVKASKKQIYKLAEIARV